MQFRADTAQEELVDFSHPMVGMLYFAPQLVIVSQQLRQFRQPASRAIGASVCS